MPWRERLRGLPVFAGDEPTFDVDDAPSTPLLLFERWLTEAIDAGLLQPHAMSLATAGPRARTLILKDVDARGFWFAASDDSPKGRALGADRHVALLFYWRELGRQVRVEGVALRCGGVRRSRPPTSFRAALRHERACSRDTRALPSTASNSTSRPRGREPTRARSPTTGRRGA